jgi:hypothetical protein
MKETAKKLGCGGINNIPLNLFIEHIAKHGLHKAIQTLSWMEVIIIPTVLQIDLGQPIAPNKSDFDVVDEPTTLDDYRNAEAYQKAMDAYWMESAIDWVNSSADPWALLEKALTPYLK